MALIPSWNTELRSAGSPAPSRDAHPVDPQGSRVLLVDDEAPLRRSLKRLLTPEGYECREAANTAEALAAIAREEISVVLLDLNLNGESGLDALDALLTRSPNLPVIMVTGTEDDRLNERALLRGAVAYLQKPLRASELRAQVFAALVRRSTQARASDAAAEIDDRLNRRVPQQIGERLASASRWRDAETGAHVRRIGAMAAIVARQAGYSAADAHFLGEAATMHDVGKIAIPDGILLKPGRLTAEEYRTMQQHTVIGASILSGTEIPLLQLAERIALSHHEHWDGGGYPHGLRAEACPRAARIVAVVDVYDALVQERVYKPAWDEARIVDLFREEKGKQFDPVLVDVFLECLPALRSVLKSIPEIEHTTPSVPPLHAHLSPSPAGAP